MHPLKGRKQSPSHIAKRMEKLRGLPRPAGSGRPENTPAVMWSRVLKGAPDDCWPWTGYRNEQGYGRVETQGKMYYAHRVIFELANPGAITWEAPKDKSHRGFLMHTCDNPKCCNPSHLRICTHAENMADKKAKGRAPDFRGALGPRAKLTEEQVIEIRRKKNAGVTKDALATEYGVSPSSISHICYGRTYQNVAAVERVAHKFAQKLTTEDVIAIRASHAAGERATALAALYGVTERAIHRVLKRWSALE